MSNIDKQALRINAQLASSGKWIKESGDGWEAICSSDDQANSGFIIAHFEGPDAKENREFIQAANPATVMALLDELEAKDKRIAEQRETLLAAHSYVMQCARMGDAHANGVLQAMDRATGKGEAS